MTMTLKEGLHNLRKDLLENGYEIETERWQGGTDHPGFLEILHADIQAQMYEFATEASMELNASQPWADLHFQERVGGEPLNPPPSHSMFRDDSFPETSRPAALCQTTGPKSHRM